MRELVTTVHAGWDGERTRGSTALEDWPDSIVTVTRDPETGERFLRAEGRDVDLDEDRLDFDLETGGCGCPAPGIGDRSGRPPATSTRPTYSSRSCPSSRA